LLAFMVALSIGDVRKGMATSEQTIIGSMQSV
jgi:hypothetical protein